MAECWICYKPLEAGANNGDRHDKCEQTVQERNANDMCTICGVKKVTNARKVWCKTCWWDDPWEGYGP